MDEEQKKKLMEGFVSDINTGEAQRKELRKKQGEEASLKSEEARAVDAGITTLSREQQSQTAREKSIRREGQENIGKNPEDVVAGGERRTDWGR